MARINLYHGGNHAFVCKQCSTKVQPLTNGSYRNHCPSCLYSKHMDSIPGDRASICKALMKPVGVEYSAKKQWILIHRCLKCGVIRRNKAALNDIQSDNFQLLCKLAAQQYPS